jgi:hypothetical protein
MLATARTFFADEAMPDPDPWKTRIQRKSARKSGTTRRRHGGLLR